MPGREEDRGGGAIPSKKDTEKHRVVDDYGLQTEPRVAGADQMSDRVQGGVAIDCSRPEADTCRRGPVGARL